jgi:hypothetical protein
MFLLRRGGVAGRLNPTSPFDDAHRIHKLARSSFQPAEEAK